MADDGVSLREINWRETFPFTHLFRAFRVAVHPSKIVLSLVLLGCLWCGGLILDAIWPNSYQVTPVELTNLWGATGALTPYRAQLLRRGNLPDVLRQIQEPEAIPPAESASTRHPIFHTFFDYEVTQAHNILMFRYGVNPFESIWKFVVVGPLWLWSWHPLFALIYTLWFLLVWSVLGGAVARIAAVHVARDEKISVRQSLTFSAGKILSFIFAPVIPVLIIFAIGVLIAGVSWILLHISYAGPIIVGLLFFLALLGGFVITLVTLGTLGGFNLMYPTVAVEGSDSFDAISRSFSYVFARPWRMLWYTIVSVVYGAVCYLFVRFFVWMLLAATWFFVNWFLDGKPRQFWPLIWPHPGDPMYDTLTYRPDYDHLKWSEAVGAGLIAWWVYIVIGLIGAFAISFYFSANTIIYYLMRREVDATELDDVYVEEGDDELDETGTPAAAATGSTSGGTTVVTESTTVRVYQTPESANPPEGTSGGTTESTPPANPGEAPPA